MSSKGRSYQLIAREIGGAVDIKLYDNGVATERIEFDKNKEHLDGKRMKKSDHFEIDFALVNDPPALGVTFPNGRNDSKERAMWVAKVTPSQPGCPKSPCYNDQFKAKQVTATNLTVVNKDDNVEELSFTIRCLKPGGDQLQDSDYVLCDPIADNKNGGTEGICASALAALLPVVAELASAAVSLT